MFFNKAEEEVVATVVVYRTNIVRESLQVNMFKCMMMQRWESLNAPPVSVEAV